MGEENIWCQSRQQAGLVWRSHELLEARVTHMPARGSPDLWRYEENCPQPNLPILWPLETQTSAPNFCSFQGPLLKVFGSNFLTSCPRPTHNNPGMESFAFFIFHNQNVKLQHPTVSQVYKLYQDIPGKFTISLPPPTSAFPHPTPTFHPPSSKLFSTYHTEQLPFPLVPVGGRHCSPITRQDISWAKDASAFEERLLPTY